VGKKQLVELIETQTTQRVTEEKRAFYEGIEGMGKQ
jgi:hypothetical protein